MKALVRGVVVFLALWGLLFLLAKVLRISPNWPLWCPALVTAVVAEAIVWLYRYERGAVTVKRGKILLGLRLLALAILLWILLEPTWIQKITHQFRTSNITRAGPLQCTPNHHHLQKYHYQGRKNPSNIE